MEILEFGVVERGKPCGGGKHWQPEHWFSIASVTNYRELGGLRQLCLIILAFCGEKSRSWQSSVPRSSRGRFISLPFSV